MKRLILYSEIFLQDVQMLSYFLSFLEFDINGSVEACMGLLNDIYEDGVKWHDIACYHTKVKAKSIPL